MNKHYVAFDLGAESGRVILGVLDDGVLQLREIHRFPNGPVAVNGTLRWDVLRIFEELKLGLRRIADIGAKVSSISCDSWGVDYVWLRGSEPLLTAPFHYRDGRTDRAYRLALQTVSREEIFAETGIQFLSLNTLYQLLSDKGERPWLIETADCFLPVGDYFNFLFSGRLACEESLASTTQLYNPVARAWSEKLIRSFGFPRRIFPEVVSSGTVLGNLLPEVSSEVDLRDVSVIASCSHDTGAAIAGIPAEEGKWAYVSSGTWSLLGVELGAPLISPAALRHNFTNELGLAGSIRFLKNISGLWLVQECRREWAKGGQDFSYDELTDRATMALPFPFLVDPAAASFLKPGDMPGKIAQFCRRSGQPVVREPGRIIRGILESLALVYRRTLRELAEVTGQELAKLHVVGGGSRNRLLNQMTADAAGIPVEAGPAEATAIGNILIQALALGHLKSVEELRSVVRKSFEIESFPPNAGGSWAEMALQLERLSEGTE